MSEILSAVALLLVIEGLLPFASPRAYRQAVAQLARLPDRQLRLVGLASMLAGVLLLYWIR